MHLYVRVAAVGAWIMVVAGGFTWTAVHAATPAMASDAPARWPHGTALALDPTAATLVLFAHPRCPCTRASLHELEWILTRSRGKIRAYVVFARPVGAGPGWGETPLRAAAAGLPGVTVVDDESETEAHRFTATTSGHVVVYAPTGVLLYSGGITGERGHEGANAGRAAALDAVVGSPTRPDLATLVFGCSLDTPAGKP